MSKTSGKDKDFSRRNSNAAVPDFFPLGLLNVFTSVATIASKVLPIIAGAITGKAAAAAQDVQFGPLRLFPVSGRVMMRNVGGADIGLLYTTVPRASGIPGGLGEFTALSVYQPLPVSGRLVGQYDATRDLERFTYGDLTVSATSAKSAGPNETEVDPLRRAVAFALRGLAIGVPVVIMNGFTVKVEKPTGVYALRFTGNRPFNDVKIVASVKGAGDAGATVEFDGRKHDRLKYEVEVDGNSGQGTYGMNLDLPVGLQLEPVVEELRLTMEVPADVFFAATAEQLSLVEFVESD